MEGVGKEEEKGALAKDASLKVAALKPIESVMTADEARQIAIDWQHEQSQANPSYGELAQSDEYFRQLVQKFPELTEEFAENAIVSSRKTASVAKKSFHIGDKVYYHGHPAVIKDMTLNPHALEVSVAIEVDGEELHISGKELKEIGNEPLMEDLQHPEVAPEALAPEPVVEPEIEKLPEHPLPVADEACMAKKEAALKCPQCGTSESVTPSFGHKLNKCDACGLAFDDESSPDHVEPKEKEAATHEELMREMVHQKQDLAKDPKRKHEEIEKFKEELHPGYKAEPHKEADIEVDAAGNAAVIEAFVNGHAEDMKVKSSNLYMRPIISGIELINYQTVIAVRVDDTIKVSTLRYSTTTTQIQSAIISAATASGKPVLSMETGEPIDHKMKREPAPTPPFNKLPVGQKYDRLSSQEPEIETKASKADVIKKFALLSRHAEIDSPWGVRQNEKGEDIIARVSPTLREKKSKEKNKKVDIKSNETI
jgi:hypothetical protein